MPQNGENYMFLIADGTVKISGGDQVLRTSTLIRNNPDRGEEQGHLQGESDGSPPPPQDSSLDDGEARNDFWSISGNFYLPSSRGTQSQTVRVERSIISYSTELYRRDQGTNTILDVMLEKNSDDYWNVDGDRELSDTWTGSTRFTVLGEKPPDGYTWSGWRLTRKQTTSRPDTLWPEIWKDMSGTSKHKEKQQWAVEKAKLDNARKMRGFFFIVLDDGEFKDILENARRKLDVPMAAAKPCKIQREKCTETFLR